MKALIGNQTAEPIWLNLEGGVTFGSGRTATSSGLPPPSSRSASGSNGHLRYLPVPQVLTSGHDWFIAPAIDARSAVDADGETAAGALGAGLKALHALPTKDCPFDWSAEQRGGIDVPSIDRLVVCHGDACVPNTLIDSDGQWSALVDLGSLGLADRWADLAVASISLGWNFGAGFEAAFFEAYGIEPDDLRIRYYRGLWNAPDVKMDQ